MLREGASSPVLRELEPMSFVEELQRSVTDSHLRCAGEEEERAPGREQHARDSSWMTLRPLRRVR